MLDRRNFIHGSVEQGNDAGIQRACIVNASAQQCIVMSRVSLVKTYQIAGKGVNRVGFISAHQMLVQGLHGEFARAGAG